MHEPSRPAPERGRQRACKFIELLALADDRGCEAELAGLIDADLDAGRCRIWRCCVSVAPNPSSVPAIKVDLYPSAYDELAAVCAVTDLHLEAVADDDQPVAARVELC